MREERTLGQCGCGDMWLTQAHPIAETEIILAVDEYHGCRECSTPLGFRLYLFNPEGWQEWGQEWSGLKPGVPVQADENGGNAGFGITLPFLGKGDLLRAVREDEELSQISLEDYGSLEDLLADWGLLLLQEAARRRKREG